jgi:hypothetical protein
MAKKIGEKQPGDKEDPCVSFSPREELFSTLNQVDLNNWRSQIMQGTCKCFLNLPFVLLKKQIRLSGTHTKYCIFLYRNPTRSKNLHLCSI